MRNKPLSEQIEIWGFEGDTILFADASFGFGLELTPVDATCWDDSQSESFSERTKHFLNGLPTGIDLQFVMDIGRGNSRLLEAHRELGANGPEIAKELTNLRIARLSSLEEGGYLPKLTLRLFVRRSPERALARKKRLFREEGEYQTQTEEELSREMALTEKLCSEITQGLAPLGIGARVLTASEIAVLFYQQWNPRRTSPMPQIDYEDVRSDLLYTDVGIYDRGFSLSDLHYRVISLKRLPERTFAAMASRISELPFGVRILLSIGTLDQEKELSKLQTQRRLAFAMSKGKAGVSDIESESKFQDLESLLEAMIAQGEKVFRMSLNIVLCASSVEVLNAQVSETLMKLRELSGAEGMEETLAAFDVFLESSLPNSRARERAKWIETSNLANFLPLFAPWPGHVKPAILLRSRLGSLVAFDPFAKDLPNFNHIVTGGSGAGKSFLTNLLLLQMLKES